MPVLCSKDNVRSTTRIQAPPRRIERHQLSVAIYTKDPTKDRKYKEVLKIFCVINHRTVPSSFSRSNRQEEHQSPLSASSAIAEATVGAGRKRRVHHNQNQEKPHRLKALTRSAKEKHQGGTSDGDTPRASLVKEPQSMPASSKNGATALPPRNHQPDSQLSASLLEPPVHTWMTIRGASYTGASKNQSKPRQGNAHRSHRLHPHEPLAGAGARATETGTRLEGLIPRRRRRLAVDDWKHKPRQAST